jgi:arylsulfatase A
MATCAEIVGEELPEEVGEDSYNFLPALIGDTCKNGDNKETESKSQTENNIVRDSIIHHSGVGHFSIRKDKWKLICKLGSGGFTDPKSREPESGEPEGQLYNIEKDPGETNNVWKQYPEVVDELTNLLEKDKKEGNSRG